MLQQVLPNTNLALHLLDAENKTIDDYSGWCSTVCDMVLQEYGGNKVFVDGNAVSQYGWWYHDVPMVDGKIHDAWYAVWNSDFTPLSLSEWLVKMFGTEDSIGVMIDGENIYEGLPQNFSPTRRGLTYSASCAILSHYVTQKGNPNVIRSGLLW